MLDLSVIICTHNPRTDYLTQTLDALKDQTLPLEQWELVIIDNASDVPLAGNWDLTFHPHARIVRENELGLTHARLRGIQETAAPLIVFVDDDNVLDPDYLEQALHLANKWPILGAMGGQVRPRFEVEPAEWTKAFWHMLAIREFDRDQWSNVPRQLETVPNGAGMVVRRQVALAYLNDVTANLDRLNLDRKGKSLVSGGDTDLSFTAVDVGLGMGVFTKLGLTHLIPANRVSEEYLLHLVEENHYSLQVLGAFRGLGLSQPRKSLLTRLHEWGHMLRLDPREKRFELAARKGVARAEKALQTNGGAST